MKGVVLSEGYNDTIFIRELLTSKVCIPGTKILSFDQVTKERYKNRKAIQQKYFERLLDGHENFDVLVKSEGGKDKIIPVTASQLPYLCKQRCTPVILIDLDNDSITPPLKKTIEPFIKELKQEIEVRFKGQQFILNHEFLDKTKEAEFWLAKIIHAGKICGKIYVIAFYRELEEETGINNTKDKDSVKLMKAKKFIQNSDLHKMFSTALA